LDQIVFEKVTSLSISSNDLVDQGARRLQILFPSLRFLSISFYSDAIVEASLTHPRLKKLEVIGGIDTDFPSYHLIAKNKIIQQLDIIYGDDLSTDFIKYLINNSSISDISVDSDQYGSIFAKRCKMPLKKVACTGNMLKNLRISTKILTLEKLFISCSADLFFLILMQNLSDLHLDEFFVSDIKYLKQVHCRKYLIVCNKSISTESAHALSSITNIISITFKKRVSSECLNILMEHLFMQPQIQSVSFDEYQPLTSPSMISLMHKTGYIFSERFHFVPNVMNNRR
jgi:hypothetical protein